MNSRIICKPLHLLDCCVETDNATCIIVSRAEHAKDLKQPLVQIRSVVGRCCKPRIDMHYQHGPISTVAGHYAKDILWPNAGVGPDEIDLTGSYDAFTFTTMLQLEDYGFCKKGEGGQYVSSGIIELGGARPNNTSGGHLCEAYTHGMNLVIENVRQLRGDVDDSCPSGPDGKRQHTYDYSEGGCRQVKDAELSANLGWAMPGTGSAMVMQRGVRKAREERQMLQGEYLGMMLTINDVDKENMAFFNYCAQGDFRLQKGRQSGLLRYPPTTACPWTRDREYDWVSVEGKGTVHSYAEVPHAIQPAFREACAVHDLAGRPRHPERRAERARSPTRRRQPIERRWRVCAAGDDQKDWDWHARAHGLQGGQRRVCAAALDDRRGSRAAGQPVALSSRVRAVSLAPQTRGLICLLKGRRTAGIP